MLIPVLYELYTGFNVYYTYYALAGGGYGVDTIGPCWPGLGWGGCGYRQRSIPPYPPRGGVAEKGVGVES